MKIDTKENNHNLKISYRYQNLNQEVPILFLHGFNGNSKSWAYQFDYFKNKRSVIAIDAPGFGQSDPADLDMLSISYIVNDLLKSINVVKCDLVGHSMGGMLSQIIASQHNNLVNKVILSCTHKGYAFPKGSPLKEAYRLRLEQRKKMSDKEFGQLRIKKMLPELDPLKGFIGLMRPCIQGLIRPCGAWSGFKRLHRPYEALHTRPYKALWGWFRL